MENKKFKEVFPNLNIQDELRDLLDNVEITRVVSNKTHTKMRVYIQSSRLIEKSAIFALEDELAKSLHSGKIKFEIVEKYDLSEQYTLENLLEVYKESLVDEMKQYKMSLGIMFQKAPMMFKDNILIIDFIENPATDKFVDDMKSIIKNIFLNRFGKEIEVNVVMREGQMGRFEEENRLRIKSQVQAVMERQKQAEEAKKEKEEAKKKNKPKKKQNDEPEKETDLLFGKDFKEDEKYFKKICDIYEDTGRVEIRGQVMSIDDRETRTGKYIMTVNVTDFTDSITIKQFVPNKEARDDFVKKIKKNMFIYLNGNAGYDDFDKQVEITRVGGIKVIAPFGKEIRQDTAIKKRVELHCHTKMSEMDAISPVEQIIRRAYEWGHPAIAITDHGVVQCYPSANKEYQAIKYECEKKGEECNFKVIYGVEAYLVDDTKGMIENSRGQGLDDTFVVFDLETTGLSASKDRIIEIGAVKISNGQIVDRFSQFVNPKIPIPYEIERLTGISDQMVIDAREIEEVLPEFIDFCGESIMVAHNAEFDMSFIKEYVKRLGLKQVDYTVVDTVGLSRLVVSELKRSVKLDAVAKALGVPLINHHRAVEDAECTALIFQALCKRLKERELTNLDLVNEACMNDVEFKKKLPMYHAIILCKNDIGKRNLYELVSISHIKTFNRKPRMMKSDIERLREGLIVGSACEAGELYQAILRGLPGADVARIANFYDYFEVQPIGNNKFMIDSDKYSVESEKDLQDINKKIIELGKTMNKMTVATCDVHFLDPDEEIYRAIIQAGNGFKDAENQAPLYLRTTDEMLAEFSYLDDELAKEIVITNPNKIVEMIDDVCPINPDKCPPVLENSEENLRNICYDKAHEMYGDNLPDIVKERLETELDSIIRNGYAVMYIMAQRLVWKSVEDGYLVGSRGSVGSSFAATMSGITECNPLEPHYYCTKCRSSFFEREYSAASEIPQEKVDELQSEIKHIRELFGTGFDLPDKICPCCGTKMKKDGLEIPFETFLSFGGNKEPDIDLNFSGEYQARAHAYTEEMFGEGNTFRAGTISGVAEKTAYGYVKGYFSDIGEVKRSAEIERLAKNIEGVKKTSGQHPGGIVIVPRDREIYEFTPIQKPANDMSVDILTTHFDYHAIESNLLKLDELGHDDPTMIKYLEEYTGTNAQRDVPFDDEKVMSLFEGPEALGITSEDIDGCPTGSLGLPELGTDFVIQMIVDTKPKMFADLVRLAGLSHGTDVWLNNAQVLIRDGRCTIATAICTRDDIMVYLMGKGIDPQISFEIMEHVRKGRGLLMRKGEDGKEVSEEDIMRENGVPEWYIWSCKTIKYMFPKAHAAAYVMMALRVAWYKVYHPLAYYSAYLSIRAKAFDYEMMCLGKNRLDFLYNDYKDKINRNEAAKKDEDVFGDMKIVKEMYARGYEFWPLDIYKAKAHMCQIIDGKIMPPLDSIAGMGDKAAEGLEEAIKNNGGQPFKSKKEMREKSGINKTVIETMSDLGLIDGMPEDSQLSIFDF